MRTQLHPTIDREAAFAEPVLTFKDWHLTILCPRCNLVKVIEVVSLLRRYGPERRFGDLFWRLRCETCRSAPSWPKLKEGWAPGRQADDIPLLP